MEPIEPIRPIEGAVPISLKQVIAGGYNAIRDGVLQCLQQNDPNTNCAYRSGVDSQIVCIIGSVLNDASAKYFDNRVNSNGDSSVGNLINLGLITVSRSAEIPVIKALQRTHDELTADMSDLATRTLKMKTALEFASKLESMV